jgi:Predicted metal-dependent protease of the PAD1/JAB1 superfamily
MIQHIRSCLPEEACGLIGGIENRAVQIFPIENEYHSPVRFRMRPEEQLRVFLALEQNGLDLIGIYHSHPTGPEFPSETDRSEFAYPGTAYLILSPHGVDWQVRGYQINAEQFIEFPLSTL